MDPVGQLTGTMWYAVPAEADQEYPARTPFEAHRKLRELGVAGTVEVVTADGRRDVVAVRRADGYWMTPDEAEQQREEETSERPRITPTACTAWSRSTLTPMTTSTP